jgi:hypothetical protein
VVPGLASNGDVVLKPFFQLHNNRYIMYWMAMTQGEYEALLEEREQREKDQLSLENRTVDQVQPNSQTEANRMTLSNSSTGTHQGENWRDAGNGSTGGFFQYVMDTKGETNLSLFVRYWGNEGLARTFNILIDGQVLVTENIVGKWNVNDFVNVEYPIPSHMLQGKSTIAVRFQSSGVNYAGGIFYLRLVTPSP